mgnify:CR=1
SLAPINFTNEAYSLINLNSKHKFGRIIETTEAVKYWDRKNLDLYLIKDSLIDWEQEYLDPGLYNNINNLNNLE